MRMRQRRYATQELLHPEEEEEEENGSRTMEEGWNDASNNHRVRSSLPSLLRSPGLLLLVLAAAKNKTPTTTDVAIICLLLVAATTLVVMSLSQGGGLYHDGGSAATSYSLTRIVVHDDYSQTTTGRFPRFGTFAFQKLCPWTTTNNDFITRIPPPPRQRRRDCTLLARPRAGSNEGISTWFAEMASTFVYATQAGCNFVADYGTDAVHVTQVFHTPLLREAPPEVILSDGYTCDVARGCYHVGIRSDKGIARLEKDLNSRPLLLRRENDMGESSSSQTTTSTLSTVPFYRFAFKSSLMNNDTIETIRKLESSLPGFQYDLGMACALGSVMELAPTADKFVPTLHSTILPSLRDEDAFVIAIYIRTGNTDAMAQAEKDGKADNDNELDDFAAKRDKATLRMIERNLLSCALEIERHQLSSLETFSRSIWLVITDSPDIGRGVSDKYGGQNVTTLIQREVITTATRGIQTRPSRKPATVDFAEAAIDWFLLGESDVVVSSAGYTFSATAALRTARPLYHPLMDPPGCKLQHVIPPEERGENASLVARSTLLDFYETKQDSGRGTRGRRRPRRGR